ncbi:MAG: dihydrofolate reductase [Solirubrobacteraceae bacterium]|nr:dihydrofolate reductase [Solirubrobacteraceae bacterium]
MSSPVRVFIATSLDGFIAGPDDDLSWLPQPTPEQDYGFGEHMASTVAILMGRRSYDMVAAMDEWFYGDTPVFVATSRPIDDPVAPTVRAVQGASAADLLSEVQAQAGEGGIYVDGGALIRSLLDEGLIDELVVTVIPVILGHGLPLFAGARFRRELELTSSEAFDDGLVQLRYRVEV